MNESAMSSHCVRMDKCLVYNIVRGRHTFLEHHTEGILGGMEYLV